MTDMLTMAILMALGFKQVKKEKGKYTFGAYDEDDIVVEVPMVERLKKDFDENAFALGEFFIEVDRRKREAAKHSD